MSKPLLPHGLVVTAVASIVVIAGCGDDGARTAKKSRFAEGNESAKVFVERMTNLLQTTTTKKECSQLDEINRRSSTRFPCPPPKDMRASMSRFRVIDVEEYGTGAVVDYKSGKAKDGSAIILFVSPDRSWGVARFGVYTKPSIGTSDERSRRGYAKVVKAYLAAVRTRDCEAYVAVALTDGPAKDVCATAFATTATLAKRLKDNPHAKPRYRGGNATYGFYTLETSKPTPENVTIGVVKADEGAQRPYVVLNVLPSPTAADQRQVRREYREQLKDQRRPGDMSPSSKPSDPAVTTP